MGEYENVDLKQMSEDISFIKKKMLEMEEDLHEISDDLHEVRPEYIEKLKKIEAGKFHHYKTVKGLRKAIEKE